MKSNIILLVASSFFFFFLTSCSSFYQIATISSDNVRLYDNGNFAYSSGNIVISYDFWSSCGNVSFVVENNYDVDITLDLTKSFFIKNGIAKDYFINRTQTYTIGSTSAKGRSVSSARLKATGNFGSIVDFVGSDISIANSAYSVEYKENDKVTIPAKSKKKFGKYSFASGEFVKCGLVRNPSRRENAVMSYDKRTSPIVVENRLCIVIDGQEVPVNNTFYVSEFRNMRENKVIKSVEFENCAGMSIGQGEMNIFAASNRYYVKYDVLSGEDRGRTR